MHCSRPRQECEDGLRTLYAAFERRLDEARARLALTPLAALLPPPMLAAKRRATTVEILMTTLPPVQNTALRLSYKVYTISHHSPVVMYLAIPSLFRPIRTLPPPRLPTSFPHLCFYSHLAPALDSLC